jgi:hypothetical protein
MQEAALIAKRGFFSSKSQPNTMTAQGGLSLVPDNFT